MTSCRIPSTLLACLLGGAAAIGAAETLPETTVKRLQNLPTGVKLAYLDLGPADGDVVVLIHGFTDTARSFAPVLTELRRQRPDLRLIAPDLRGHGTSSMPTDHHCRAAPQSCFAPVDLANDVTALLDVLGIERASVVGHSLGSFVALELAIAEPRRIGHLGLLGSAARTSGHEMVEQMRDDLIEGAWSESLRKRGLVVPENVFALSASAAGTEAEAWIRGEWVAEAGAPAEFLAAILPETLATPFGTWIGTIRALTQWDARDRLGAIGAPTLVMWTSGDAVFPEEPYQQELRQALGDRPNLRWLELKSDTPADLGHNFHWAAPIVVATELARFLPRGEDGGNSPR